MKKLALAALFVGALAATSFAQETKEKKEKAPKENQGKGKGAEMKGKSAENRADAITKRMMKVTGAPADKKQKVYDINLETEKLRDTDRATNANNKEGLKNARKKRNAERDTKLKQVFSADEYAKWEAHKKEVKEKHKAKKEDAKKAKLEGEEEIKEMVED